METRAIRPIDCPPGLMRAFIAMVAKGGEVPIENLQRGVPMADMLLFTINDDKKLMGVSALRHPNSNYHKHLFELAGVPEMYNPDSLEACWLYIDPDYRGLNVWKNNSMKRMEYLGNRPVHGIMRVENKLLRKPLDNHKAFAQVGDTFTPEMSDYEVILAAANHDPVYDPTKRLYYGHPPEQE
ncbi:hypothetical protein GUA87_05335 [Sneathiella sp. P13V-1]|uniref:hypothetical protein n=1 Tax=Sneathiella sp. P13V-1 TaxID=2697366 RepID=UPI00187BC397|nr:hypothetical protein [Sneathiella sp. P13V-1]MBE7636257.1 hypothetical protein [Sneathiella sp. P13V-1]